MPLAVQADRFVKSGRALRRKMWWNNFKVSSWFNQSWSMLQLLVTLGRLFTYSCHHGSVAFSQHTAHQAASAGLGHHAGFPP